MSLLIKSAADGLRFASEGIWKFFFLRLFRIPVQDFAAGFSRVIGIERRIANQHFE
jgi:hypothetical protein